jgi:hypothetical protein
MILVPDEGTTEDDRSDEPAAISNVPPPPECRMYKYAPRYGYTQGNDEMLIFFTRKLEEKKYGSKKNTDLHQFVIYFSIIELQIRFESVTPNINWSAEINTADIEVKDPMVSFRIPKFPFSINARTAVKIILQQRDRMLEKSLEYFYIPPCN